MLKTVSGADFDVSTSEPRIFSQSVEGLEGTGKTKYALLTCPTPIVHVNFGDRDATSFLYDMSEERRKQVKLFSMQAASPEGWTREEGRESLRQLKEICDDEVAGGKLQGGTFALDSGSTWWEVIQEVYVAPEQEKREASGGKKRGGLEYMQGNLIVSGIVSWLKNQGCYVVITHRKRQDWDKEGPIPGRFSAQVNRKVPYLVEVRLDLKKACAVCGGVECQAQDHVGRKHSARLLKFSANTGFEGMEIDDPTFGKVYSLFAGEEFPRKEALQ